MFQIFKVFRKLHPRSNRIGKKIFRQRSRPMRLGLRAIAILAQQGSYLPMEGPDGLLVHLNQLVVLLDLSSHRKWEGNAPVGDSDFPWIHRFEQIHAHNIQFCCECLLGAANCFDVTPSVQLNKSFTDTWILRDTFSALTFLHGTANMWVPTTLLMRTLIFFNVGVPIPFVVDSRPPSSFGHGEGSRGQDQFVPLFLEGSIRLLSHQPHAVERLVKMGDPAHKSCVCWGPRLAATKHSKVLVRSSASALQSMRPARKGGSNLFCHHARWQPSPESQNRGREAHKK